MIARVKNSDQFADKSEVYDPLNILRTFIDV